jgi:predicted RNA-binding Zn-ribbon protein involved in translation (DUF1610 family)
MWKPPMRLVRFEDRHPSCPSCGKSMIGEPIPKDRQHLYGATHFMRWIGITNPQADKLSCVECPDCGKQFPSEIEVPKYEAGPPKAS